VKPIKVTVVSKKVVIFLKEKIGVTLSVAAQGDTNPSDATGATCDMFKVMSSNRPEKYGRSSICTVKKMKHLIAKLLLF